jgi:hypothetical protein
MYGILIMESRRTNQLHSDPDPIAMLHFCDTTHDWHDDEQYWQGPFDEVVLRSIHYAQLIV